MQASDFRREKTGVSSEIYQPEAVFLSISYAFPSTCKAWMRYGFPFPRLLSASFWTVLAH